MLKYIRHYSPLTIHQLTLSERYMDRCLELAIKGAGYVAPNPMVGAVLVYEDKIIGEGWHQQYGGPHAEVNCIDKAVQNGFGDVISRSVLYVSLEPCAHFGKTPPCADLIIKYKIPEVVIGCSDPFNEVNGKGIEKLQAAGVLVVTGILEKECREQNKRFFIFHTKKRPYVILKWAQTKDGFMAAPNPSEGEASDSDSFEMPNSIPGPARPRLFISSEYTNRLVHQWRSEEAAILVGTNTALYDDPELTTRLWPGPSPVRLVVDMNLRLPTMLKIFDHKVKTIVFNTVKQQEEDNLLYYRLDKKENLVQQLMSALYKLNLQSVIVEGGATLLQSFIDEGLWDEARVIVNSDPIAIGLSIGNGLSAPVLPPALKISEQIVGDDTIGTFRNKDSD